MFVALLALLLGAFARADSPSSSKSIEIKMPLGIPQDLWQYFIPQDNPVTAGKVELGRRLFFDPRLSADGRISCSSCHDPKLAFTDGRVVAEGINGRPGSRNSPTLLNAMFNTGQFWDGRAATLEDQAKLPLTNPDEMGNSSYEEVVARLSASEYAKDFVEVFAGPVTIDRIARAIASYERTLVSGNSALDRFQAGDVNALSESARNGLFLFRTKARCGVCHAFNQNFAAFATFPFLTDGNFRNTGVAANFKGFDGLARRALAAVRDDSGTAFRDIIKQESHVSELGRFAFSFSTLDVGAFRTPSLRNVGLTAPYFHDGSAASLEDVVRYYVKGGNPNLNRDWQLEPVALTESEQRDIVEFLKSLTGEPGA